MPRKLDLTGKKFGRWNVLYEVPERKNNNIYWHCRCDCGKEKDVRGGDLVHGNSQSCGCLRNEKTAEKNSKNLLNQKFGRLLVIEKTSKRRNGSIIWKCQCDCGNIVDVCSVELIQGDTQSCGCLQKERVHEVCSSNLLNQKFGKLLVLEECKDENKIKYAKDITWKCKCDCGNIHYALTSSLKAGNIQSCGCTKSKGEEKISKILLENNINFIKQKNFPDCKDIKSLFFDFYINDSYLLEYDGQQHYQKSNNWYNESLQKRDEIKNNWCKEHNIPLIRIPYWHYDNLCLEDLLLDSSKFIYYNN